MVSKVLLYERAVITYIQTLKIYKVKISIISDMGIVTGNDQWNSKKTSKKCSTGKVKDRRYKTTTIK